MAGARPTSAPPPSLLPLPGVAARPALGCLIYILYIIEPRLTGCCSTLYNLVYFLPFRRILIIFFNFTVKEKTRRELCSARGCVRGSSGTGYVPNSCSSSWPCALGRVSRGGSSSWSRVKAGLVGGMRFFCGEEGRHAVPGGNASPVATPDPPRAWWQRRTHGDASPAVCPLGMPAPWQCRTHRVPGGDASPTAMPCVPGGDARPTVCPLVMAAPWQCPTVCPMAMPAPLCARWRCQPNGNVPLCARC